MQKRVKLFVGLFLTIFFLNIPFIFTSGSITGVNAPGTTGTFGDMPVEIDEDNHLTLVLQDLNDGSTYIITATAGSGIANITWTAGDSRDRFTRQLARPSSGAVEFNLYGYNVSLGYADFVWNGTHALTSPTVLDTALVSVKPSSDYNPDILTNFIGLFVTGGIIVSIVVLFRKKVL
jgi:hypothetical protein